MKIIAVAALMAVYYILVHYAVYRLYPSESPDLPKCLIINKKDVTIVSCTGIAAMTAGSIVCGETDFRLMLLYYFGMLMLSVLTITDLREKRIPNKILLIMLGLWIVISIIYLLIDVTAAVEIIVMNVSGMIFCGVVFLLGYFITKKKLGGGDVKLSAVLGLYFTIDKAFGVLLYGLILCSLFSMALLIFKKASSKEQIPLCPFLLAGASIMLLIN